MRRNGVLARAHTRPQHRRAGRARPSRSRNRLAATLLTLAVVAAGTAVGSDSAHAVAENTVAVASVFQDVGYAGAARDLGPGVYDLAAGQGAPIATKAISSLKVPAQLVVWLCNTTVQCWRYPAGNYTSVTPNDSAAYVAVAYAATATPTGLPLAATVYRDSNGAGAALTLASGQEQDLFRNPGVIGNDQASSFQVVAGALAIACGDAPSSAGASLSTCQLVRPGIVNAAPNDSASTVIAGAAAAVSATVFTDYGQLGTSAAFGPGVYDLRTAGAAVGPDAVSSLVVPAGLWAWLCDGAPGTCRWYPAGTYPTVAPNDTAELLVVARLDTRGLPVGGTLYLDVAQGGTAVGVASGGAAIVANTALANAASSAQVAANHAMIVCDAVPSAPGASLGTCASVAAGTANLPTALNDRVAVAAVGPVPATTPPPTTTTVAPTTTTVAPTTTLAPPTTTLAPSTTTLAATTTTLAPTTTTTTPPTGPNSALVTLYAGSLSGAWVSLRPGIHDATAGALGSVGDNNVSSLVVPNGQIAWLCPDAGTSLGVCRVFTAGAYDTAALGTINDLTSTVVVEAGAGQAGNEGAVAYADNGFSGLTGSFPGYGAYDVGDGSFAGVGNDALSSIKVREGFRAFACANGVVHNQSTPAACYAFTGDVASMPAGFNDLVSHLAVFPAVGTDPAKVGSWSNVTDIGVAAIHSTLLPSGKVLLWEEGASVLLDPSTSAAGSSAAQPAGQNLFCSTHVILPNGDVVAAATGGGGNPVKSTAYYSAAGNSWVAGPNLNNARYYPGSTLLGNGTWFVAGGNDVFGQTTGITANPIKVPEVLENGTWRALPGAAIDFSSSVRGSTNDSAYWPWLTQMPDGRVFYAGPDTTMRLISTAGSGSITAVGNRDTTIRTYGSYAQYTTGKMLVTGGANSVADTRLIDFSGTTPTVTQGANLNVGRRQFNLTILADGNVIATGGNSNGSETIDRNATVLSGEIWNASSGTWTKVAPMTRSRQYHSSALLLPDGRLLVAGETANGWREPNVQYYSPPYLFAADGSAAKRPVISSAPTAIGYGSTFTVTTSGGTIAKAHLVKLGSVTHATNFNQRLVPLTVTGTGGTLTMTAPSNANLATPGQYMLFVVGADGTPSVAKIVTLG